MLGRRAGQAVRWGVALGLSPCACGEPAPSPTPVVAGPAEPGTWAHALGFEGGVRITGVVTPVEVEPGQPVAVGFTVNDAGKGRRFRVGLWPPRPASRQVAQGGQGAPPVEVPVDPRARFETVEPSEAGEVSVELVLPAPWHAAQAVLTVELLDGDRPVPAVDGPRREDGRGMLGVVDVPVRPTAVVAVPMPAPPTLDGRLDEPGWAAATVYPLVGSLDGEPYDARPGVVRWAWDAEALYVAVEIDDPDVWSEYTQHDDPLWKQEVFEVFVFGDAERRGYLELQVSPRGTTFDARFERYRKGDEAWDGTWRAAVSLRGTVDDRRDRDEGWSAELALPWPELCEHTEITCPPRAGQHFVVNAFRFERPRGAAPVGLALSPPRVPDFHAPENAAVLELGGP